MADLFQRPAIPGGLTDGRDEDAPDWLLVPGAEAATGRGCHFDAAGRFVDHCVYSKEGSMGEVEIPGEDRLWDQIATLRDRYPRDPATPRPRRSWHGAGAADTGSVNRGGLDFSPGVAAGRGPHGFEPGEDHA